MSTSPPCITLPRHTERKWCPPGGYPLAGLDIRPAHVKRADGDGILTVHGQEVASSKNSLYKPMNKVNAKSELCDSMQCHVGVVQHKLVTGTLPVVVVYM